MRGRPNVQQITTQPEYGNHGRRVYDEAKIIEMHAAGRTYVQIAETIGCSLQTISYTLHPEARLVRRLFQGNRASRKCKYRKLATGQLYTLSDRYYRTVERFQACLDDVESELARRKRAKNAAE